MTSPPPLYGLLLAGGKSTRMGQDKALLTYHQAPQLLHGANLLAAVCQAVFLSRSPAQKTAPHPVPYPIIVDGTPNLGPMGGVLSAMEAHPHAAWLVLACDMPLVEISTLQALCTHRDPTQQATVFYHPETHQPEPLCALYEPTLLPALRQHQEQGQYSLRAIISQVAHHVVRSPQKKALDSCNDPVSHQQMRALLQKDFPKSYS